MQKEQRFRLTGIYFSAAPPFPEAFLPAMEVGCGIGQGWGVQYGRPPISPNPTTVETVTWPDIIAIVFLFNKKKMPD